MNNTLDCNVLEDPELDIVVGRRKSAGTQVNPAASRTTWRPGDGVIKVGKTNEEAALQIMQSKRSKTPENLNLTYTHGIAGGKLLEINQDTNPSSSIPEIQSLQALRPDTRGLAVRQAIDPMGSGGHEAYNPQFHSQSA